MAAQNNTLLGWAIAFALAFLLMVQALSMQHSKHREEIDALENKIADYEMFIEELDAAYDSLLEDEIDLIERHNEEILTFDTLSVDSLRGYFASRYGFFDVLYADSTEADSTGH